MIRDYALLGLALMGDGLTDIIVSGSNAYNYGKLFFWFPSGYKRSNLYNTVNRLLKTGNITKIVENGKPYLQLNSKGNKLLARKFCYFKFQNQKWDKYWRLVIFDISEKHKYKRDVLREKLNQLGFGMFQKSIYITPYDFAQDMAEFLSSVNLLGQAFVLTAKHQFMGDAKKLAIHVWNLKKLNFQYKKINTAIKNNKPLPQIKADYLHLLTIDPFLPKELLPDNWKGDIVRKNLLKLMENYSFKSSDRHI